MQEETSFGAWLRKQRRALDLSRQALSAQVGCAEVTLRRIEAGALKPSKELANIFLEKLGIPETERSQWISFARGLSGFPPSSLPSSNKSIKNLPVPLTTFIGRESEQTDVINLIAKHRLVTLTGTGGIGKTRLSIIVGEQVLGKYTDGVWLVELAPILDPLLVPRSMAIAVGLRDEPQRPVIDMLSNYLQEKQILIILDNCEHLLDACAQLADTLLKHCPGLKILATSREVLGILGEATYRVPSLELPDIQQSVKDIWRSEAARLFEERAQLARMDFSLTIENFPDVTKICTKLDGMPLAIELAAARVGTFSTKQIAKRLEKSFSLLTTGNRTALPRHQTLQATIDWSYELLSVSEQILFRRLSVFVNGWTLDAAECICSDGNIKPEVILVLLNHLINKSLVMMVENNGKTRYHMLEIIRQYAYEKLLESGEELYTRDHHLKYFLKLSELIEPELVRAQQIEWIARTNIESSNIRAALQHAIQTDIEAGLYITGRLGHFWTDFDSHEATRWLTDFLQSSESTRYPQARAVALSTMSRFLFNFEQYDEAHATAEEALALFRIEGNQYGEVDMLVFLAGIFMMGPIADPTIGAEIARQALSLAQSLGDFKRQADALNILAWDHRDFKRAFSSWEEAVKLYRQVGHWTRLARSLSQFGFFLLMDGQLDAAQRCMDEANSLFQQLNIKGRSSLLAGLGQIALIRGNYEQARAYFQEDARISNEIGNRLDNLWAKCRLGYAELLLGDSISAQHNFAESAQSFQKDGNRIGVVFTLEGMSSLYLTIGKADVAAQLIGWADTTRQKIKDTRPKLEQVGVDKVISACISKMGDKTFLEAYNKGKYMSLDEAVDLALKIANERE